MYPAVHHITGPRFWHEIIQHADIADVRRSHVNKAGDTAPQIQYVYGPSRLRCVGREPTGYNRQAQIVVVESRA